MNAPTYWLNKLYKEWDKKRFPVDEYINSCPIYSKRKYAIFLLTRADNNKDIVKIIDIISSGYVPEIAIPLYLKHFASGIPNILLPIDIYLDMNPLNYKLFTNTR